MRIIDAHTHIGEDRCAAAVAIMDRSGIDASIDVSPNLPAALEQKCRAFAAYPGRLYACCGVDPSGFDAPGWAKRECAALERAAALGAVGVKLDKRWGLDHADAAGALIPVDHPRLDPLYETAADLGLPVIFHSADPRAFFDPADAANERREELDLNPDWSYADARRYPLRWWSLIRRIENVLRRHPGCLVVGAHFGCAAEEPEYVADVMRDHPRYHADTAARIGELGRHRAEDMRALLIEHQDRVMFGTDIGVREHIMLGAPQGFEPTDVDIDAFYAAHRRWFESEDCGIAHPTPVQGRWTVDGVGLPEGVLARIYAGNALRVFARIRGAA